MMMNSIKKGPLFVILAAILLASCQADSDTLATTLTSTPLQEVAEEIVPSQQVLPTATIPAQGEINPLTGLPVFDSNILDRLPIMVKVSNYPRSGRPHAGLSFADIVFDYYIGNGTNRFLAVFYGNDSPSIGPVRSGRLVDAELVRLYQGILGYGSADEDTDAFLVKALGERAISFLEAPCPAFCGEFTHSVLGVYASSADISSFAKQNGIDPGDTPDLQGMYFNDQIPSGGAPAEQVNILFNYYNRAEWKYDAASGTYLRWIEQMEGDENEGDFWMIPLVDRVTGQQLAFDNVVILFAHYIENAPSEHEIEVMKNIEGKRAVFYRDGQMFEGQWKVPNSQAPIQFFDSSGDPFALKPGNTWIVLADDNSIFDQKESGAWELFFMLTPDA
ncbi:MAG: DUF3048 C-terminal domain-containing protein [Anaerolineaceae bacterium]